LNARLQAAAARCYPDSARRFRQAGVAQVEFCLDARGALMKSSIQRSSGIGALDDAATGCVLPGALPAGPEVGAGCFTLPVRFGGAR
jgi:TonB family protein